MDLPQKVGMDLIADSSRVEHLFVSRTAMNLQNFALSQSSDDFRITHHLHNLTLYIAIT